MRALTFVAHRAGAIRTAITSTCLALALVPSLAAAQQAPRFDARVELVQLQVQVADEAGRFVPGLGPEDFLITVDGERRAVESAYAIDLRGPAAEVVAENGVTSTASVERPMASRRRFVLFFDLSYSSRRGMLEARRAALQFLDAHTHPDDLVAVATGDRNAIELLTPFVADRGRAREAVESLGLHSVTDLLSPGQSADDMTYAIIRESEGDQRNIGGPSNVEKLLFAAKEGEAGNHLERLRQFAEMLKAVNGRKHVVLFSRGLEDTVLLGPGLDRLAREANDRAESPKAMLYDTPEITYGSLLVRAGLQELVTTLREADAVIHAVDPTGLRVADIHDPSAIESGARDHPEWANEIARRSTTDGFQTLTALASGTGGTVHWRANDLTEPLAQIVEATSTFYVLAYRKNAHDPPTVKIEVDLRPAGVQVVSAPTRLSPPPRYAAMTAAQRQLQIAELLHDPADRRDIGFAAEVVPFAGTVSATRAMVAVEVPGLELERLAAERGGDIVELELGAFAFRAPGSEISQSVQRGLRVDVAAMRGRGSLAEQAFRYAEYFDLPEGDHQVRVLLREHEVGAISGVTRHVVAAPGSASFLAPPLLVAPSFGADTAASPRGAREDPLLMAGRRLDPIVDAQVRAGDSLLLLLVGYRLPRDLDGTLLPALSVEVRTDERAFGVPEFEILGVSQVEDAVQMLVRARLPQAVPPGGARLVARLSEPASAVEWEESTGLVVLSGASRGATSAR